MFSVGNHKSILDLRLNRAALWLKKAKGCRSFQLWDVSAMPREYRDAVLQETHRLTHGQLQPRDGEATSAASHRKLQGLARLDLLQMVTEGVGSITISTKWPLKAGQEYVAVASVSAVEGSKLAALLPRLRARRQPSEEKHSAIGAMKVNVAVPQNIRTAFAGPLNLPIPIQLNEWLTAGIGAGQLSAELLLHDTLKGPIVEGSIWYPGIQLPKLPTIENAIVSPEKLWYPLGHFANLSRFGELVLAGEQDSETDELRFRISTSKLNPHGRIKTSQQRQNGRPHLTLVDGQLDLSKVADGTEGLHKLLQEFEKLGDELYYHQYQTRVKASLNSFSPASRAGILKLHPEYRSFKEPPGPFHSLADKLQSDDELSLTVRVYTQGSQLNAKLTMSRELHRLYRARRMLAGSRVQPQ